ncbi:MAG: DUF72 domain-containing protein [Fervidicoccaceae archaeon]
MVFSKVKVGVCGFPTRVDKLVELVDVIEVQESFYDLVSEKRLRALSSLRERGLILTWKAWQTITHPSSSPTWRRLRARPPGRLDAYGWLRPTRENLHAAQLTLEQAARVGAEVVVFQTPPSMPLTDEAKEWARLFFEEVLGLARETAIAWEPRGPWRAEHSLLNELSKKGVVVVTDVLRHHWHSQTLERGLAYTRLHGLGGSEVNYKYKYAKEDLYRLKKLVLEASEKCERVYVLFNNIYMLDDAVALRRLLEEGEA